MSNRLPRLWFLSLILITKPTTLHSQTEFQRHTIDNNLISAAWVQAVDMDGDGDLDLVTGSYNGVDWWQNTANNFKKNFIGSFRGTWAVHADDVDGDGDIDVIGASSGEDEFSYWQRTSSTNFSETSLGDALGPESVHAADLDGDGDLDIVGAAWADDQILWWRNDGRGRFERKVLDADMNNAHSVRAGDLDNDGDPDVLATGVGGTRWYRNDGNQKFKKHTIHNKGGWSVFIDDIDGDGDQDFLRPQRDNGDVVLFWNDGTGSFDQEIIEPGFGDCWAIATGDIDGDGTTDIAGAGFAAGEIKVWLNDGQNRFPTGLVVDRVDKPRGISIADMDNDGDGDVAAAIRGDRDLAWYEVVGTPKSITVNSPSDQDELFSGSNFIINWHFAGSIDSVKIELSIDGTQAWTTLAETLANDGQYAWRVPAVASDSGRIRVSDTSDPKVFGTSSGWFSIKPTSVVITTPNGGESWPASENQLISWTTIGVVDSVRIEYSLDNGADWLTVVDALPNQGDYLWSLPDVTSDSCVVRISDSHDVQPNDRSDDLFSIRGSAIVLLSPTGGESWRAGGLHEIVWDFSGRIDSVNLEYSLDNGRDWLTVANRVANSGSYSWPVPAVASDSCLVRVSDASDGRPTTQSSTVFSIGVVVSVSTRGTEPDVFHLQQNYPNPFNLSTRIAYQLPEAAKVRLVIYDLLGREVRRLVDGSQPPGVHEVVWNGLDKNKLVVSSGVYILQFRAGVFVKTLKVLLAK